MFQLIYLKSYLLFLLSKLGLLQNMSMFSQLFFIRMLGVDLKAISRRLFVKAAENQQNICLFVSLYF